MGKCLHVHLLSCLLRILSLLSCLMHGAEVPAGRVGYASLRPSRDCLQEVPGPQLCGQTLMTTLRSWPRSAPHANTYRKNLQLLHSTHGNGQRSHGIMCTWTLQAHSWGTPFLSQLIPTQSGRKWYQ